MRTRDLVVTAGLLSSLALLASGLEKYTPVERRHWAFRERSQPEIPKFTDSAAQSWVRGPIDAFVLDRLRKEERQSAPQADRGTLIRRGTFDLTGLPPTPDDT